MLVYGRQEKRGRRKHDPAYCVPTQKLGGTGAFSESGFKEYLLLERIYHTLSCRSASSRQLMRLENLTSTHSRENGGDRATQDGRPGSAATLWYLSIAAMRMHAVRRQADSAAVAMPRQSAPRHGRSALWAPPASPAGKAKGCPDRGRRASPARLPPLPPSKRESAQGSSMGRPSMSSQCSLESRRHVHMPALGWFSGWHLAWCRAQLGPPGDRKTDEGQRPRNWRRRVPAHSIVQSVTSFLSLMKILLSAITG
jgi:hypothetical protein